MRKLLSIYFILCSIIGISQENNNKIVFKKDIRGTIMFASFYGDSTGGKDVPEKSESFIRKYLTSSQEHQFKLSPHKCDAAEERHEHYDQYYKGIKVEGAGYNFHFFRDKMQSAHGHFAKIDNLNITPLLAPEDAAGRFAQYKGIPKEQIRESNAELIIIEKAATRKQDTLLTPTLVYKVFLCSNHRNNNETGFIDARTGEVVLTEPYFDKGISNNMFFKCR